MGTAQDPQPLPDPREKYRRSQTATWKETGTCGVIARCVEKKVQNPEVNSKGGGTASLWASSSSPFLRPQPHALLRKATEGFKNSSPASLFLSPTSSTERTQYQNRSMEIAKLHPTATFPADQLTRLEN